MRPAATRFSIVILFTFCLVFVLPGSLWAEDRLISALAGTSCGFDGDGGPALAAKLCTAGGLTSDPSGNIYVFDNQRIRRITPQGIISTIAGNGVYGASGDGGPALAASIGWVGQLAYVPGGRICFGDQAAYKIRCIDLATGILHGYGSGTAGYSGDGGHISQASFGTPTGLAVDAAGHMYVADFSFHVVRRIDYVTGIVTTVAGPGPGEPGAPLGDGGPAVGANLFRPDGLAVRPGKLYIADGGNYRVRMVDLATGVITTIAGNGSPYPSGDGPAIATGMVPRWLAADQAGNLFVDVGSSVRMIDSTGTITTVIGILSGSGWGLDDVPANESTLGGVGGIAWDEPTKRIVLTDSGTRLRQVFFTPPTTTLLTASPNPALPGTQMALQATVSPAGVVGSVRFYEYITLVATVPVTPSGTATHYWTANGGSSEFRAVYGGDLTHNLSRSAVVPVSSQRGNTTTTLTSSANPSTLGQNVILTASVSPSAATGMVNFMEGQTLLGSAALSGGTAAINVSGLTVGNHVITAVHPGSTAYLPSASPALTQTVQKRASITLLTASPNPSVAGESVVLTATVSPASATGTIEFKDGAQVLGTVTLSGGTAILNTPALPAGNRTFQAVYSGDATTAASTSANWSQTVKTATALNLSSSRNPANSGQNVTFTARSLPVAATGPVQFFDGAVLLGTGNLSNGSATYTTRNLSKGTHTIRAVYAGNAAYGGSTAGFTQTIR